MSVVTLTINLLGGFDVALNALAVRDFRSAKSRALLAWLAAQPDVNHSRATLSALLWGDLTESAARTNLRVTLADLKKLLAGHPALEISRHEVRLDSTRATIDVVRFLAGSSTPGAPEVIATALALYRGDFLAGLAVDAAPEFADWRLIMQERLHRRAMQAFDWLLPQLIARTDWPACVRIANQQLTLVPWHEPAHRALMTAYAAQGQPVAVRDQYERCRAILQRELGSEPAAPMQALLRTLLAAADARPIFGNLPAELTPFYGRTADMAALAEALTTRHYRLLTLTGLGGSGKTRLALHAAATQHTQFADGVWFVPLAGVQTLDDVAPTVADALGLHFTGSASPQAQLLHYLHNRDLLLLLDNLEQLPDAVADWIAELLRATTSLVVLATSRRRLNLRVERVFALGGLAVPPAEHEGDPTDYPAVRLFVEQLRRVGHGAPDADALRHISELCRLLDGLPLGIELAAAQADRIALPALVAALHNSFALLHSDQRDLPPAQRSLDAILESTWARLDHRQRRLLAQLTVFQGSFDLAAAQVVVAADDGRRPPIERLVAQSLVQHEARQRFTLHPLVQAYAARKLTRDLALDGAATYKRHSTYYLAQAVDLAPRWHGTAFAAAHAQAVQMWANVTAAWQYALAQRDWPALGRAADPLRALYRFRVLYREGVAVFTQAYDQLTDTAEPATALHQTVLGRCDAARAWFLVQLHDHSAAAQAIARALAHAAAADDPLLQMDVLVTQQILATQQDDFARSLALGESVAALAATHQKPAYAALARVDAGYVKLLQGEFSAGRDLLREAEQGFRAQGDVLGLLVALRNLGLAHMCLREMELAEQKLLEALALARTRRDTDREIYVIGTLASVHYQSGDYGRAIEAWQQQLTYARANGLEADVSACLANLGLAWLALGQYAQAERCLTEALPLIERVESSANFGAALLSMARLQLDRGDPAAAAISAERVLQLARDNAIAFLEGNALALLGRVALARDDLAAAAQWYDAALAHRMRYRETIKALDCYAGLARVAAAQGNVTAAAAHIDALLHADAYERHPAPQRLLWHACSVLNSTQPTRAAQLLRRAHALLQVRAQHIADPTQRESFLTQVAVHAAIRRAFDALPAAQN